jgi:hypothetical protein
MAANRNPLMRAVAKPKKAKAKARGECANSDQALYDDAADQARRLKRKYRAIYNADPHRFRTQVRKAHARVFRLKPGPKADARIARAARDVARGADLKDLFRTYIDGHNSMTEFTRTLAEEGFRKKVNRYLQRHPRLGHRSKERIAGANLANNRMP